MLQGLTCELSSPRWPRTPSDLRRGTRPHKRTAPSAVSSLARLASRHELGLEENDVECLTWLAPQKPRIPWTSCSHTVTSKFSLGRHGLWFLVWGQASFNSECSNIWITGETSPWAGVNCLDFDSFFFWLHLYWSIIALQWCVSFCFITKWISYTYTYVPIYLPSCIFLPPTILILIDTGSWVLQWLGK